MPLVENDTLCPVCSRPIRVLTILRRVQGEETHVLQCKPCGLSTTKTVDAPGSEDIAPQGQRGV